MTSPIHQKHFGRRHNTIFQVSVVSAIVFGFVVTMIVFRLRTSITAAQDNREIQVMMPQRSYQERTIDNMHLNVKKLLRLIQTITNDTTLSDENKFKNNTTAEASDAVTGSRRRRRTRTSGIPEREENQPSPQPSPSFLPTISSIPTFDQKCYVCATNRLQVTSLSSSSETFQFLGYNTDCYGLEWAGLSGYIPPSFCYNAIELVQTYCKCIDPYSKDRIEIPSPPRRSPPPSILPSNRPSYRIEEIDQDSDVPTMEPTKRRRKPNGKPSTEPTIEPTKRRRKPNGKPTTEPTISPTTIAPTTTMVPTYETKCYVCNTNNNNNEDSGSISLQDRNVSFELTPNFMTTCGEIDWAGRNGYFPPTLCLLAQEKVQQYCTCSSSGSGGGSVRVLSDQPSTVPSGPPTFAPNFGMLSDAPSDIPTRERLRIGNEDQQTKELYSSVTKYPSESPSIQLVDSNVCYACSNDPRLEILMTPSNPEAEEQMVRIYDTIVTCRFLYESALNGLLPYEFCSIAIQLVTESCTCVPKKEFHNIFQREQPVGRQTSIPTTPAPSSSSSSFHRSTEPSTNPTISRTTPTSTTTTSNIPSVTPVVFEMNNTGTHQPTVDNGYLHINGFISERSGTTTGVTTTSSANRIVTWSNDDLFLRVVAYFCNSNSNNNNNNNNNHQRSGNMHLCLWGWSQTNRMLLVVLQSLLLSPILWTISFGFLVLLLP